MSTTHPLPANFPVRWAQPEDVQLQWQLDKQHFENQLTPLAAEIFALIFEGFNVAATQLALPIRLRLARFNTYCYLAFFPAAAPPASVIKTLGAVNRVAPGLVKTLMNGMANSQSKQYLDKIAPLVARLNAYWYEELLPEIKQHLAHLETCDLRGATLAQLRVQLDDSLKRAQRLGEIHFLAVLPAFFALNQFEELYCDLFKGATPLDALKLLQGFDNKSLEADLALWQLSRLALSSPAVRATLETCAAADVLAALEKSDEGQRFLSDLRVYLQKYGQRSNTFDAFGHASWIEDPTIVIKNLKDYASQPTRDLDGERAALNAEREQVIADARAKLRGYPQPVIAQFESLLKAAQIATVIHEDHNHWIDQRWLYQMRRLLLELGRRLAESDQLETAHDVFYLTLDELRHVGTHGRAPLHERKSEMERFHTITPPMLLGTPMPFDPPDDAFGRTFMKVMGAPIKQSTNGHDPVSVLKGHAGSPGVVRGPARVIRSLTEAGKLQRGDVLVAEATLPPWTPLFATASAVVTDAGGILSHCAVVAREYHIPAVVGTGKATTTFRDGQMVEVDGSAGVVRVVG